MVKKFLKVVGILPDQNAFKLTVSGIANKGDTSIYLVEGRVQDIDAFASVYDDQITIITKTQAKSLLTGFGLPKTGTCTTCNQPYNIPEVNLDVYA